MTHHAEAQLISIVEEEYLSKGYAFKRENAFAFKGHVYALDAVAKKGPETIGFEFKTHIRNIDYIFYRLLAYSLPNQNITSFYLVLPAETLLEKTFLGKLQEFGIGLITVDVRFRKLNVEAQPRHVDSSKKQEILARAVHLSPNSSDVFEKAIHLFGRESPFDVVREFVDSVLNNVLLGGLLASGIVLVTQNHVPPASIDFFAFGFIGLALIAWVVRLAMAYGKI